MQRTRWELRMCCFKCLRINLSILLVSHIIAAQNEGQRYLQRTSFMRLQPEYMKKVSFPCAIDDRNDTSPPNSVHKLRPGDIKVIAAIGDSLTSGVGAKGKAFIDFLTFDRGVVFSIGGEDTWRKYLTIPNILKLYNPNIVGYSLNTSEHWSRSSQLNTAIPAASAHDFIDQLLIRRMKGDSRIHFENDWKMITVFIGHNDICYLECFNKSAGSVAGYIKAIEAGLDYLQETIPRALINLIPVLDPTVASRIPESNRPLDCRLIHLLFCTCYYVYGPGSLHYIANLALQYQEAVENLVNSGRYDIKDDFTVVVQPWIKYFNTHSSYDNSKKRTIDDSHMTYECYHFSQKGHAMAANSMWNNLLEPVGNKSLKIVERIFEKFNCPSKNAPYFFTQKNSKIYYKTGHQ